MLQDKGSSIQEHHKLKYTDEALAACVKFASQYIQDRFLPDKAGGAAVVHRCSYVRAWH